MTLLCIVTSQVTYATSSPLSWAFLLLSLVGGDRQEGHVSNPTSRTSSQALRPYLTAAFFRVMTAFPQLRMKGLLTPNTADARTPHKRGVSAPSSLWRSRKLPSIEIQCILIRQHDFRIIDMELGCQRRPPLSPTEGAC